MSSAPSAPRPVFAKRKAAPQYLAPGEHLKVASRKPAAKREDAPPAGPPRDPWESLNECPDDEPRPAPPHHHRDAASSTGGGGGHPFSKRLSVSIHSTDDAPPPPPQPRTAQATDGDEMDEEDSGVDDAYYTTTAMPEASAAERAQRVLDAQHRALEAKQLQTLTQQGVARRPKTLVRNRHGRLNAIAAFPASGGPEDAGPALRIADAPASPSEQPEKVCVRVAKPKSAAASRKKAGAGAASPPKRKEEGELVDSRPSTPPQRRPEQLDIDLD